jgi:hypothetical protein
MLSGGGIFDSLDYSFSPGHEDGSDTEPNGPGGGSPALRRQLRILSEFLQEMPLEEMAPDMRTVKHAAGVYARVLSSAGHEYGIYLDGTGATDVTLALPAGTYSGKWIDVKSGAVLRPEQFSHAGGDKVLHTPEFRDGIALRLKPRRPQGRLFPI